MPLRKSRAGSDASDIPLLQALAAAARGEAGAAGRAGDEPGERRGRGLAPGSSPGAEGGPCA